MELFLPETENRILYITKKQGEDFGEEKYRNKLLPDLTNREHIRLGEFSGTFIERAVIPSNIKTLETGAFLNCAYLEYVKIPEGITSIPPLAFAGCVRLKKIRLPKTIKEIGERAFYGCRGLEQILLPRGLEKIGKQAFSGCIRMEYVIGLNNQGIDKEVFEQCFSIRGEVKTEEHIKEAYRYEIDQEFGGATIKEYIGNDIDVIVPEWIDGHPVRVLSNGAFANKEKLVSVWLPNSIVELGEELFAGCKALQKICMPEVFGTEEIPQCVGAGKDISLKKGMFRNCVSLKKLMFSSYVTAIGQEAFFMCTDLEEVVFQKEIKQLSKGIFHGCGKLTRLQGLDGLEIVEEEAFLDCRNLDYAILPDTLKEIGGRAFSGCDAIQILKILPAVEKIGKQAFLCCKYLKSLLLLSESPEIMEEAFLDCNLLESVTVPKNCSKIAEKAFAGCENLMEIILQKDIGQVGKAQLLFQKRIENVYIKGNRFPVFLEETADILKGANLFLSEELIPFAQKELEGKIDYASLEISVYSHLYSYEQIPGKEAIQILQYLGNDKVVRIPELIEGLPVTVIEHGAFENHKELEEVFFSDKVEMIRERAFAGCEKLHYIIFPKQLTGLGKDAFCMCTGLRGITFLAKDMKEVPDAFSGCSQLSFITMNHVTKGADPAWEDRKKFLVEIQENHAIIIDYMGVKEDQVVTEKKAVMIPEIIDGYPVCQIGKDMDEESSYEVKGVFAGCEEIEAVSFPPYVRKIAAGAFYHCTSLKGVVLPKQVELLSKDCFRDCISLRGVNMQAEQIEIGEKAFFGCNRLEAVAIRADKIKAEQECFCECDQLNSIFFHSEKEVEFLADSLNNLKEKKLVFSYKGQMEEAIPYEYEIHQEDQTVSILKYRGEEEKVIIPPYIAGLLTVEIKEEAFLNNSTLSMVVVSSTIRHIGTGAFKGCRKLKQAVLSEQIKKLEKETFSMCVMLTQVEMPSGLVEIGENAFLSCKISEIELPENLEKIGQGAFCQCRELKRIIFPKNLKTIEKEAFADCSSLRHIMLPSGISVVYENTFKNCTGLKSVLYQNPDCEKRQGAFLECSLDSEQVCETIPAEIKEEYVYALDEKTKEAVFLGYDGEKEEVDIPEYIQGFPVTAISDVAFGWKRQLKRVCIPKTIESIGSMAFYGCENLEEIFFLQEEEGTRIYKEAFFSLEKAVIYVALEKMKKVFREENCTCPQFSLQGAFQVENEMESPLSYRFEPESGVLSISPYKENGESDIQNRIPWHPIRHRIRKITVEQGITSIGSHFFEDCTHLEQVSLPDTLIRIEKAAFKNCERLSELILPQALSYIGEEAFCGCTQLTGKKENMLLFPDSLEEIEKKAFYGCRGLEYLIFPESVQKIGMWAFRKCENLSKIYMEHVKKPKKIGREAFFETAPDCEISVKFQDADVLEEKFENNVTIHVPIEGTCQKEEGGENHITWRLYYDGLLEIRGKGEMEDYEGTTTPWYEYSAGIQKVSIEGEVTHIGARAFHSCGFFLVDLPRSLKSIGMEAFAYCNHLMFVKIPPEVEEIGINSFFSCRNLKKVLFMSANDKCKIGISAFREVGKECVFYTGSEQFGKRLSLSYKSCSIMEMLYCETREIRKESGETFLLKACYYQDGLLVVGSSKTKENIRLLKEQGWFWNKEGFKTEGVKCVFLDATIRWIGKEIFKEFPKLERVAIEGKLERIEQDAFGTNISDIPFYVNAEMSERMLKYAGARNVSRWKW